MAITFLQQRKRQRYLIPIFILTFLLTLIVVWFGFFRKKPLPEAEIFLPPSERIGINFEVLKSPILEKLQSFEEIPALEGEGGRGNPFIPY